MAVGGWRWGTFDYSVSPGPYFWLWNFNFEFVLDWNIDLDFDLDLTWTWPGPGAWQFPLLLTQNQSMVWYKTHETWDTYNWQLTEDWCLVIVGWWENDSRQHLAHRQQPPATTSENIGPATGTPRQNICRRTWDYKLRENILMQHPINYKHCLFEQDKNNIT